MNLKVIGLAAVVAFAAPAASQAATFDAGSGTVITTSDGQMLTGSNMLFWNVQNIVNDTISDSFKAVLNFVTGSLNDAGGVATVLQFNPSPGSGIIKNLALTVFAPASISQTFLITDANGNRIGDDPFSVSFRILGLDTLTLGTPVFFELQGDATPAGPNNPGFTVALQAVPLPATALLFLSALAGLGFVSRRRAAA